MAYQKGKELTSGDVRRPKTSLLKLSIGAILVWPWKMVSVSVRYLFCQPTDEKIKTWPLRFAKDNPNMEKALFDWPIVLQYNVTAKYRLICRKFSGMKFFHPSVRLTIQKPRTFVSVRQTNQIALFPFVCRFCFVRAFAFRGHTKMALTKWTRQLWHSPLRHEPRQARGLMSRVPGVHRNPNYKFNYKLITLIHAQYFIGWVHNFSWRLDLGSILLTRFLGHLHHLINWHLFNRLLRFTFVGARGRLWFLGYFVLYFIHWHRFKWLFSKKKKNDATIPRRVKTFLVYYFRRTKPSYKANTPFPSCFKSLLQSEAKCEDIDKKIRS